MSIMWKYLDKRAAAIKAIGDYDNMQFIIRNTKDEITVESDRMVGVGSPNMDGMPTIRRRERRGFWMASRKLIF